MSSNVLTENESNFKFLVLDDYEETYRDIRNSITYYYEEKKIELECVTAPSSFKEILFQILTKPVDGILIDINLERYSWFSKNTPAKITIGKKVFEFEDGIDVANYIAHFSKNKVIALFSSKDEDEYAKKLEGRDERIIFFQKKWEDLSYQRILDLFFKEIAYNKEYTRIFSRKAFDELENDAFRINHLKSILFFTRPSLFFEIVGNYTWFLIDSEKQLHLGPKTPEAPFYEWQTQLAEKHKVSFVDDEYFNSNEYVVDSLEDLQLNIAYWNVSTPQAVRANLEYFGKRSKDHHQLTLNIQAGKALANFHLTQVLKTPEVLSLLEKLNQIGHLEFQKIILLKEHKKIRAKEDIKKILAPFEPLLKNQIIDFFIGEIVKIETEKEQPIAWVVLKNIFNKRIRISRKMPLKNLDKNSVVEGEDFYYIFYRDGCGNPTRFIEPIHY